MIIIGLTGGIGSGKTTVANLFVELGIPVFIADQEAKYLMKTSKVIRRKLIALFGAEAYIKGNLNKAFLSKKIFNDKALLQQMNAIIHPKVAKRFKRWVDKQDAPYVMSEVAILFENGSYKNYNYIITVIAPEDERIKRVLKRDSSTEAKVRSIINNQWNDADKINLSDYVINNESLPETKKQVKNIHKDLISKYLKAKF